MAFDITSVLKDVPDSGTGREQIEYLRLEQLESDTNNFYQLSKLDELAANIQMCGLQQPIRVRKCPEKPDSYTIVSGHRRRAAIELLASEEPERWAEIPCIVEQDEVSPALQQLRLIYANANTRVLLPAEISEQAVQVEKLLYQLKEEGYEFPGRMRDHVAQAVGASKSKLSRLKVIREGLAPCWGKMFKKGHLHENPAYELARLPRDKQELIFNSRKTEDERRYIGASRIERYADRFKAGRPGHRTSGLRCEIWNSRQPGAAANSKHKTGKAFDFWIEGLSSTQLLTLCQDDPRTSYAYIIKQGEPYVHVDVK